MTGWQPGSGSAGPFSVNEAPPVEVLTPCLSIWTKLESVDSL
jgi:hypothetical protein